MKNRKTLYCSALSGSDGPEDWKQNGKGRWTCLRCQRTGLRIRTRHRSWPPPVLIPLYGDRNGSTKEILAYAKVSPIDAPLARFRWLVNVNGYAYRRTWTWRNGVYKRYNFFMQREVLGLDPDDPREGHHRDDDRQNNQRWNLEPLTGSENNRAKYYRNVRSRTLP